MAKLFRKFILVKRKKNPTKVYAEKYDSQFCFRALLLIQSDLGKSFCSPGPQFSHLENGLTAVATHIPLRKHTEILQPTLSFPKASSL